MHNALSNGRFLLIAHKRTSTQKTQNPSTTASLVPTPNVFTSTSRALWCHLQKNYRLSRRRQPNKKIAGTRGVPLRTTKRWLQKLADCILPLKDTPQNTSLTRNRHSMAEHLLTQNGFSASFENPLGPIFHIAKTLKWVQEAHVVVVFFERAADGRKTEVKMRKSILKNRFIFAMCTCPSAMGKFKFKAHAMNNKHCLSVHWVFFLIATFRVARLFKLVNFGWLVGVATDRNASVTLACVSCHFMFPVLFLLAFLFNLCFLFFLASTKIRKKTKKSRNNEKIERKKKNQKTSNKKSKNEKEKEASKGYPLPRRLQKLFFLKEMLWEIVQQLRQKTILSTRIKKKKKEKHSTLNPQSRTPPFRRLTPKRGRQPKKKHFWEPMFRNWATEPL